MASLTRRKRFSGTDEQLEKQIVELLREKRELHLEHRLFREDVHAGLDTAISAAGVRFRHEAVVLQSGPLDDHAGSIARLLDLLLLWSVAENQDFKNALHAAIETLPAAPGQTAFSPLSKGEFESEVAKLEREISIREVELARRGAERAREAADRDLAEVEERAAAVLGEEVNQPVAAKS